MTVNEIVDELRATRPQASDALRLQVLTIAARPVTRIPTLGERLRGRRRLAVFVPAAAALAMTAAVAIGVTRSGSPDSVESAAPDAARSSGAGATGDSLAAPPPTADATTAQKSAPGPIGDRAERYSAALSLQVDDTDALSSATQQALAIARDLGGYVVSVHYATGDAGVASVTLRVPSSNAADAVTRLSSLGTILGQNVQIDDLQETLDTLDRREQQLRARIAALTAAIERAETDVERARLEEQRAQARAALRDVRVSHAATIRRSAERHDPARPPHEAGQRRRRPRVARSTARSTRHSPCSRGRASSSWRSRSPRPRSRSWPLPSGRPAGRAAGAKRTACSQLRRSISAAKQAARDLPAEGGLTRDRDPLLEHFGREAGRFRDLPAGGGITRDRDPLLRIPISRKDRASRSAPPRRP